MNNNRVVLVLSLIAVTATFPSCIGRHKSHGGSDTVATAVAPKPADTKPVGKATGIQEDEIRALVAKGAKLYTEIGTMGSSERSTINGERMARIDPAKVASLKALRSRLAELFTDPAIDSILSDYGVVEQSGKLWLAAENDDDSDISLYDEAEISGVTMDSSGVVADIEVPLGDSGQTDERTAHLRKTSSGWKIANDLFGSDDLATDDSDDE